jgi:membrane-bound lytic murein transglycosylase D
MKFNLKNSAMTLTLMLLISTFAHADNMELMDFLPTRGPASDLADANAADANKPTETEDSKFTPEMDEDTPVSHDEIAGEKNMTSSRSWRAPDFSHQETALGYGPNAFETPKGMERQVKFWIDIYSKYTTDQGVLHDSEIIDLIYDVVDFSDISSRTDLNAWQKDHMKTKRVKEAKRQVIETLKKLQACKDPSSLNEKEKKIWAAFENDNDKKKFLEAAGRNRLRFQLGQKDRIVQGIYFSGRYLDQFEKIFKDAGLPIELARLPFVESSFNVLARSKVGASGLWQIMPYTMKGFMKRDLAIDLRNHPAEATKLAAKLMRINYNMLQSWPLAMTGYNHGPSGVLRLTKKYKTRDLGELVQNASFRKRFGFASRNFYASFLAVLEVTSKAPQYLGTVTLSQPLDSEDIKTSMPVKYKDVLRWFDGDDLKAQVFNPHITRVARAHGRAIPKGVVISIPKAKLDIVQKELSSADLFKKAELDYEKDAKSAKTQPNKKETGDQPLSNEIQFKAGANSQQQTSNDIVVDPSQKKSVEQGSDESTHRVRHGETLIRIAHEYGVAVKDILQVNNLRPSDRLRVGQLIKIP